VPGEYTLAAVLAAVAVVVLEWAVLHTGLFARGRYWVALVIVLAFQVPVDGWLTARGAPVVEYATQAVSGVRVGSIPVEDFGFGFALVTLTLLLWERRTGRA
jgi:lycopene cyclase domain-containing protein